MDKGMRSDRNLFTDIDIPWAMVFYGFIMDSMGVHGFSMAFVMDSMGIHGGFYGKVLAQLRHG
jgi:hypothetical protein